MSIDDSASRESRLADIVHLLQTISRQVHTAAVDDPQIIELSQLEGLTMQFIDRHPGVRASLLAAELGLKHSNASAALRELERKGMVRRAVEPADRRAAAIWPTDLAERNLRLVRAHWARLLAPADIDDDDLATAVSALSAIETALSSRH